MSTIPFREALLKDYNDTREDLDRVLTPRPGLPAEPGAYIEAIEKHNAAGQRLLAYIRRLEWNLCSDDVEAIRGTLLTEFPMGGDKERNHAES